MSEIVQGVGTDAPIVTLEGGGRQSYAPYRLDLVDPLAFFNLGEVLRLGAEKYDNHGANKHQWKKIPVESHLNKALIHIYAFLAGDTQDDHLGHAQCRVHMALATQLHNEKKEQKQ